MAKKERLVTLTLKVPPEVDTRIRAFTRDGKKDSEMNRSQVARRALLLGLHLIEGDETLLLGDKQKK